MTELRKDVVEEIERGVITSRVHVPDHQVVGQVPLLGSRQPVDGQSPFHVGNGPSIVPFVEIGFGNEIKHQSLGADVTGNLFEIDV